MVPNGWEKSPVGKLCKSIVPGRNKPKVFDGDIPWVTTPEISGKYIPSAKQKNYISQSVAKECGAKIVPKGAVIIAAVGELGLTAIAKEEIILNQQLHAFVCPPNVNNEYLAYFLSAQKPYMDTVASKTTIPYMNKSNCESIPVLLPPLSEQHKIAKILSTWDKAITTTEKLIDVSKQQKKALMQQLLTGKKRLVDPETGKAFEGDWEEVKLETAAGKIFGGGTPSRSVPDYWNGCIPWVTVKDLVSSKIHGAKEHISELGLSNSSANIVPKGHVIIATRMAVGKAVVATCNVAINQDLKAISPSDVLDSVFLHYWFMWKSDLIEGMGTGSTVKGVQISSIKSMGILLPAVPEQRKIASVLTAADKDIELLEAKLAHLKQEKKALMQQLLTGKRRVKVAETEAA